MLANYLPILIFMCITLVMGSVFIILGKLLGPSRPDAEKNSPYECGFEAFEDSRMKFDVRYYLVVILFIIFDLEIAFLFPSALSSSGRKERLNGNRRCIRAGHRHHDRRQAD